MEIFMKVILKKENLMDMENIITKKMDMNILVNGVKA